MRFSVGVRWALVLTVAVAFGCDSGSSSSSDAAVASGAGDCAGVCGALMSSHCFYGGGESDCNTSCTGWDTNYGAGSDACKAAWKGYKDCMVAATIDDCGGVATWNVMPCRAEWDHTQNYCLNGVLPTEACMQNAAWDAYCTGTPAKPTGNVCRGDVPAGCTIAGTSVNADTYCCP